jgi:hypothetical protein
MLSKVENKIVSPRKVKNCRRCGNSVIRYRHKTKLVTVDVFHQNGFYIVILKNQSVTEHNCG